MKRANSGTGLLIFLIILISGTGEMISREAPLTFDVSTVPFSYRGSYLSVHAFNGRRNPPGPLGIYQISRRSSQIRFFTLEAVKNGMVVEAEWMATPFLFTLQAGDGKVELAFESDHILRFRSTGGLGIRLRYEDPAFVLPASSRQLRYMTHKARFRCMFTALKGNMVRHDTIPDDIRSLYDRFQLDVLPDRQGEAELVMDEYHDEWWPVEYLLSFEQAVENAETEWKEWISAMVTVPDEYHDAALLAMYINWASIVSPRGWIRREGMLMSKIYMNGIWSWDHCFNAIATAFSDPELAWDQIMVVFDNQHEMGMLPDGTYENDLQWGFRKPPIHGWALGKMMEINGAVNRDRLKEIYPRLVRWTNYWLNYRDDDGDGIPQYNHGNDSGWDNSTVFGIGCPVEAPDLMAFLVLQMDQLAVIADKLSRHYEARQWREQSEEVQKKLIENLWNGEKFLHPYVETGETTPGSMSSLSLMPLVLGEKLPDTIRETLVNRLKTDCITDYGIATESPKSRYYRENGYWQGPIWAPETMLFIDGLDRAGEKELARDLARKFCDLCREGGFAENFGALTGEPLVDPAYTWTSSVFLYLAHHYLQ
jgi:hypothetical protein